MLQFPLLTTVSVDNPSIDPLLHTAAPGKYSETTISKNVYAM